MHIIHITLGKANPNRMNGVGVSIHNIASAQAELGHDVRLWGIANSYKDHDYPSRPFTTELFEQPRMPFSIPKTLLKRLETTPKDSVFHLHGGLLPIFWTLAKVLKKYGFRYLYTPHGAFTSGAFENNNRRKTAYMRLFEHRLMHGSEAVMVSGKGEKDFILSYFPALNVQIIPNGYELLTSFEKINKKTKAAEVPIFCYCGRLNRHHKGLDILIDGFAEYRKKGGIARLVLIGGGPDLDFLRNKAQDHEITSEIEFTGPLFDKAKQDFIQKCDLFVHTSRNEGFPSAVLEAAALGLPLLVSEATNVGDYVRQWKSGWVLPKNEATEVAKAFKEVEKLWLSNEIFPFAQQSLTMIQEAFLKEKIAHRVVNLYQNKTTA
jgi:glycosyltransferase involved in cell wall biosynthesis